VKKGKFTLYNKFVRATRVELPGESSVYEYTLEYVTTYLLEEFLENRMKLLEG